MGPEQEISHRPLTVLSNAQVAWHVSIPKTPLHIFASIKLAKFSRDCMILYVSGGFWAIILSRAAWKKSWVGCDPTRSIIAADRSVAITGGTARAQLLTA